MPPRSQSVFIPVSISCVYVSENDVMVIVTMVRLIAIENIHFLLLPVCKSCLVNHLENHNTCPTCDIVIHQSHPLNYVSYDRTMQDIVYKLVPHLQSSKYQS